VRIIIIGIILLVLTGVVRISRLKKNEPLLNLILMAFLCLLIIVPQLFIYSNLGIAERYYIPLTIGLSMMVVYILNQLSPKKWVCYFYILVIFIGISWQTNLAYKSASGFTNEGRNSNNWISKTFEATNENTNYLLVTHPIVYSEWNNSIKIYFEYIGNRRNIYSTEAATTSGIEKLYKNVPLVTSYYDTYNSLFKNMKFREQPRLPHIQCILIFPELERDFLVENADWFKSCDYVRYESGQFIMYSEK